MLPEILKNLGLNKQESEIFLNLARMGEAPASRLASRIGMKRTTCYQITEALVKKNILKRSIKFNIRYYSPASPAELQKLVTRQISPLQEAQTALEKDRAQIQSFYHEASKTTRVSFYEGYEEIKLVYDRILEADDGEIYSMLRKQETSGHPLSAYWKKYLKRRQEKGKKSYSLVPQSQESARYIKDNKAEKRQTVTVPENAIPIFGDLKVSGDIVALVSQHEGRIFGLTIDDPQIAGMFKGTLKTLWKEFRKQK